jgi:hypothetical protein
MSRIMNLGVSIPGDFVVDAMSTIQDVEYALFKDGTGCVVVNIDEYPGVVQTLKSRFEFASFLTVIRLPNPVDQVIGGDLLFTMEPVLEKEIRMLIALGCHRRDLLRELNLYPASKRGSIWRAIYGLSGQGQPGRRSCVSGTGHVSLTCHMGLASHIAVRSNGLRFRLPQDGQSR